MADEHGSRFTLPWSSVAQRILRREPATAAPEWRDTLRSRLVVCAVMFAVWTVGIEARLFYLQVVEHGDLMARANRQQQDHQAPPSAARCRSRGNLLAYRVDAEPLLPIRRTSITRRRSGARCAASIVWAQRSLWPSGCAARDILRPGAGKVIRRSPRVSARSAGLLF